MYKLGQYIRKRYDKFLGEYTPDSVYAKATNFKRTKATLQLLLAAMYPPTKDSMFHPDILWQPIPYQYDKMDVDVSGRSYLSDLYK